MLGEGDHVGRYVIEGILGEGGMGTVYLAEHVTIKKRCAIKLLNPEYAHKSDLVERFLQEARAASSTRATSHSQRSRVATGTARSPTLSRIVTPGTSSIAMNGAPSTSPTS